MSELEKQNAALRKRIAALEQENSLFKKIYAGLPIGCQVYDNKGVSFMVNPKLEELLGLPNLEEGVGHFNVLTDEYTKSLGVAEKFRRVYESGEPYVHELVYDLGKRENEMRTRKDKRIFHETIIPLKDNDNSTEYVLSFLIDLTEIRQAQIDLEKSEERWKFAIEGNMDGLWDWNLLTNDVYFSTLWKSMLGYQEHEISGSLEEWDKRVHPEDKEAVYAAINKHLAGETDIYINEHRVLCKDGKYKWILDRGKVISYTPEGKPARMIGTHRDISRRLTIEKELRESEVKFKTVFESSRVGISITNEKGDIIEGNPASEKILGISLEEHLKRNFAGKEWKIVRTDGSIMPFNEYASVRALTENRIIKDQVMGIVKESGEVSWISVNAVPISLKGYGVMITYADITEITRQKQRLSELNKTRDKFFSIIAHDLRSPFNSIKGFSYLLEQNHSSYTAEKREKLIKIISRSASQASNLLENLLEWSRSQTGSMPFAPALFPLKPFADEVIEHISDSAGKKKISISTTIPDQVKVVADKDMLNSILRNLLGNAVKFTPEGGEIALKASVEGKNVKISILDNGVGMSKEMIRDLFSLDKKTSLAGTADEKGTGLGLLLVKEFIEAHDQQLHVESEPGKGTQFYFFLKESIV